MKVRPRSLFRILASSHRVGSTVQVVAVRTIVLAANVTTGVLSAALLGPQGRGVQAALMVGPQFLGAVSEFGLHASMIYNMKVDPERERDYLSAALVLGAAAGILGLLAGWILAPLWLWRYDAPTIAIARALLMVVPVGVLTHILMGALEARGRFGTANRLMLLACLATLAILGVLWTFGLVTPTTAAAAYLLPALPICGAMWWQVRRMLGPSVPLDRSFVRRLLHYGLRFYGIDVLSALGGYLDQLLLVLVLAPEMVGIYVVAQSASRVLNVIPTSVAMVLFPRVAARSVASVVEIVGVTARLTSAITAAAALGLGLVGPYVIQLLYGTRFAAAIGPFRLLLIETVLSNLARILYQVFSAVGRPEVVSALECIGVGVSMTAMLLLVPALGMIGAAVGLLVGAVVRLTCVLVGLPLILGIRRPGLLVGRTDILRVFGQ